MKAITLHKIWVISPGELKKKEKKKEIDRMCLLKLHFSPRADLFNIVCISWAAGMRVWREAVCGWGRGWGFFAYGSE